MTRRLIPAGRTSRTAISAIAFAGVATSLTGCMYLSPAQTDASYTPADGAIATAGPLTLSNVLIVTSAKGAAGNLQGLVTNNDNQPVQLGIALGQGTPQKITVPALTSVRLDGKSSGDGTKTIPAVKFSSVAVAPGEQLAVTFATANSGASPVQVPVLLDQPPYGTTEPTHAEAPTSTPSGTTEPVG